MNAHAVPTTDALSLLEQLQRAGDPGEALAVVFEHVLLPRGVSSAVGLVRNGTALKGVLGLGVDEGAARAFSVPLACTEHPLVRAALTASCITGGPDGPTSVPGMAKYVAIPAGDAGGAGACAVVAIATEDGAPVPLAEVETLLARAGPWIERIFELDGLRHEARRLKRQTTLFSAALDALPDPALITDAENNVLLRNRRADALLAVPEEANEGRRRAVEINNLLFSSFLSRAVISGTGRRNQRELNLVDPAEGADLLFEVISTPLPPGAGEHGATISILRDVTDLKRVINELERQFQLLGQAEVRARRERDRLNLILENVSDPILVTDSRSNLVLMNPRAEALFDIPAGEDARSRVARRVRANDAQFSSFILGFALEVDESVSSAEFDLADPVSGDPLPVECVSGKVMDERGELTAVVSILHDLRPVVENRRLADALAEVNEDLESRIQAATEQLEERNRRLEWQSTEVERAYRLKSEFLASMSHELRTPINALIGYTALMRDGVLGELSDRQAEALDRMATASRHLLELVNDVLDLAKIEAGKMPVHADAVELDPLLKELSQTIEPLVRKKGLAYVVDVAPDLPSLTTDSTKLKQIVFNLLSNAVKFTQEGQIRVQARRGAAAGTVEVEVRDTGIGISQEHREAIFEDFRQVDQSSTREFGGTGLGLSIVRKLVDLLGGRIRVESEEGEGSVFTVTLPLRTPGTEPDGADNPRAAAAAAPDEEGAPGVGSPG